MSTPFDYVNAVSYSKKDIADENFNKEYVPYIVNHALSFFIDTVLYANEMNINPQLSAEMQYKFYMGSLRPRKRFAKWPKYIEDPNIKLVQEVYKCNKDKARDALRILNAEQLAELKKIVNKGGV